MDFSQCTRTAKSAQPGPRTKDSHKMRVPSDWVCVWCAVCSFFGRVFGVFWCRGVSCGQGLSRGLRGANTQDWALFWPKVDRKLGIVGCSLFGTSGRTKQDTTGPNRTSQDKARAMRGGQKGLHCSALDCSKTAFFPVAGLLVERVRRVTASIYGWILVSFSDQRLLRPGLLIFDSLT